MIRAVYDTNILVSGLLWGGKPAQLIDYLWDERVRLLCSDTLFDEVSRVMKRDKFTARFQAIGTTPDAFLENLRRSVEFVTPAEIQPIVSDPKDNMVLACAMGGQADVLISGDDDLLRLGNYNDIPILTASQFIERMSEA